METKELSVDVQKFELIQRQAKMFLASGFFGNIKDLSQACAKMQIAQSLGLEPVQGLMGIHMVQGRLTVEAALLSAIAKRSGYEFRALKHDNTTAKVEVRNQKGEKLGESEFTLDDAKRAGLTEKDNWKKYPKNMLWARAMSNACRWFCSDAFGGPVYVPEELGVDDAEPAIEAKFERVKPTTGSADALNALLLQKQPETPAEVLPDSESDLAFEIEA